MALKDMKSVFAPNVIRKYKSTTPISNHLSSNFGDDIGIFEYGWSTRPEKGDKGPGGGGQGLRGNPGGNIIKVYKNRRFH